MWSRTQSHRWGDRGSPRTRALRWRRRVHRSGLRFPCLSTTASGQDRDGVRKVSTVAHHPGRRCPGPLSRMKVTQVILPLSKVIHAKIIPAIFNLILKISNSYRNTCLPPVAGCGQEKKRELEPGTPVVRKAILAIDRSSLCRLKRYFTILTTVCTDYFCHFTGSEISRAAKI